MQVISTEMLRRLRVGVLIVIAFLVAPAAQATHIIGGEVSMKAIGTTPGLFRLQLNQYWDETKTGTGNRDPSVTLLIYRKQNPKLIESIVLNLQETKPLTFDNEACAKLRKLSFTQALYYKNYQFDPTLYTDPGGYYMVWERCCRNDGLTNVDSSIPAGLAMTFYFEFPPMTRNSKAFTNSSPDFRLPNGDYICVNKPFTFDAGATDVDGDELRYSLVTPLNGYTTRLLPMSVDNSPRSSYPTITWGPGYGLTNIIPGNPALSINTSTGLLSVRASREGLYLFTVQCEEFRNGERIGVIRRDFQLPVTDCAKNTPPPAVITVNSKPDSSVVGCAGQTLVLAVEKNPIWAYQWQKDGKNLAGSTSDTIHVLQSGVYTVVKSQAQVCSNDTISQAVKVTIGAPTVKVSLTKTKPYCIGDTITLQANGQTGDQYRWLRDGKELAGEQKTTLQVTQSGNYAVRTRQAATSCEGKDSISVTLNAPPTAQIAASVKALCQGDSVVLTVSQSGSGYRYLWQQNNARTVDTTSRLVARQAGTYRVTVTGPTGCTANTDVVSLTQYDRPTVQLDSISPTCGSSTVPIVLHGQPAGGTYAGPGVTGDRFNPAVAGVGQHQLTYTVTSDKGCRATKNQVAVVSPGPVLTGTAVYFVTKGSSVQLTTQANEPISGYQWQPPTSLSQTDVASPVASPTETTTYQLTAISTSGCSTTLSVTVEVVLPLYIPSAFSPNSDGRNDSWEIFNINLFPLCEVSIYNRWGELIFYSRGYTQPWDGTYKEEKVSAGIYTYQISTGAGPISNTYRGQLTVIR